MDGLSTTWDLLRYLLIFFGLPVVLLVLPTLVVVLLALRALRGWERPREPDQEQGLWRADQGQRGASWSLPVSREPDLAGWWFTAVALLPVLIFNATVALPNWSELLLSSWAEHGRPLLRLVVFLVATSMIPLLASYAAGARLALPIVRGDTPWWSALGRGAGVAATSLLLLFLVVYFDVLTADYRMTLESPQQGLALANGALGLLATPVLISGALAGWALLHLAHRWTLAQSRWVGGERVSRVGS